MSKIFEEKEKDEINLGFIIVHDESEAVWGQACVLPEQHATSRL